MRDVGELVRATAGALGDLVLPRICAGCGVPGVLLCRGCVREFTVPHLAQPRRFPAGFPPTVAAAVYAGPVRPAVNAFKEHGRAELARPLGAALALAVAAVRAGVPAAGAGTPVLLVPLPATRAALRARGRDHVAELARAAVAELRSAGVPAEVARLLGRSGRVADSAGLSSVQRRENLAGSFAVRGGAVRRGVLLVLVDDVVTSGATLTEAAAALAGTSVDDTPVLAAVVAATPRRPPAGASASHLRGRRSSGDRGPWRPADRLSGPREGD
ncbi:ComF family protein [Trujillonella endophytica]|uniref:Predicted amidophosphoribosyltransferases n=1 Tax=Trujillonella endophytica TaxID=673521 RepID=A0A1H8RZ05_9ACTN|nr:ComF family protein [Trujillella endophytica]SEO71368.1 Predicted amidophosphoribosyltransferases [Trujillella endophytica]